MGQDLNLLMAADILRIRIAVTPDVIGVGHILDLQLGFRGSLGIKAEELVLVCIEDARDLDIGCQHVRGRSVNGEPLYLKPQHIAEHIHFLDDAAADQLYIRHAV